VQVTGLSRTPYTLDMSAKVVHTHTHSHKHTRAIIGALTFALSSNGSSRRDAKNNKKASKYCIKKM